MNTPENNTKTIFRRPVWVTLFALTAAIAWGWAYPLIKLGMAEFSITPDMTGSKMLFAGIRFCLSGLIILVMARVARRDFHVSHNADWLYILAFSLFNTTLHYACFYFGLSHSEGSRAALLNSMSVFLVVIFACVFFKTDSMTVRKAVGCVLGAVGIVSLNVGGNVGGEFTFFGDGMIMLNALCGAIASLMTRGLGRRVDVFVGTGYALALGGALLIVPGIAMGGSLPRVTAWGIVILALLIAISTVGFSLYNKLLSCNPVGKVAIYNSLIPVVGVLTSCMCLGETFHFRYVLAGVFATSGIYVINKGKR